MYIFTKEDAEIFLIQLYSSLIKFQRIVLNKLYLILRVFKKNETNASTTVQPHGTYVTKFDFFTRNMYINLSVDQT